MADVLTDLVEKRHPRSFDEYDRALREVIQEIMLLALWRAKFFERTAFYGGTALRILHGLDRFSEDLDFSLLGADPHFQLEAYFDAVNRELVAFGLEPTMEQSRGTGAIESAFAKMNTLQSLIAVGVSERIRRSVQSNRLIKIKLEVDVDPPGSFSTEAKYVLEPVPFAVRTFALGSLFAGKVHALLARRWVNRAKGRDWYDFVFFVSRGVPLDMRHLEARLRKSGHWTEGTLDVTGVQGMLSDVIEKVDLDAAKEEVCRFLIDPRAVDVWSKDFFRDVAGRIRIA
ncbi:MAG: nucleotidyl transferase AbiEii/AbiGii toxin family protein [Spirochaetes bacterium]|nr:nucleotidyl transferase AbiEii/AbiGii toxin family protein [Spirochaetota bacterium]